MSVMMQTTVVSGRAGPSNTTSVSACPQDFRFIDCTGYPIHTCLRTLEGTLQCSVLWYVTY